MCPAVGAGKIRVGPSGKSAKHCQWQRKRAGFEEVPRLADTTVTGNRLARRWATAGPYERVARGAMGGRPQGSPLRRITRGCGTAGRCRHRPLRMTRKFVQARADRVVRAYGSVTRGAMGGRPQGSPLRRVTRGCGTAGRWGQRSLRDHFGFIYIGKFIFPGQKRNIYEYII